MRCCGVELSPYVHSLLVCQQSPTAASGGARSTAFVSTVDAVLGAAVSGCSGCWVNR